jgi:hypothetical protein
MMILRRRRGRRVEGEVEVGVVGDLAGGVVGVEVEVEEQRPEEQEIRVHLRRIRGKSRTRPVGRIIIGDSRGRRRLPVGVVCLVDRQLKY